MRPKAVIFDLWETLIDWDRESAGRMLREVDELVGSGFAARWDSSHRRYIAPIRTALAEALVPEELIEEICTIRLGYHRRALVPRPGAVDTLRRLRELGYLLGLITVCSEDIEVLWPETEFAGLFDAEIFSSRVGVSKPDPRIYLACCEALGVEPHDAVFVGDGANDELRGAAAVGMTPVLLAENGVARWDGLDGWDGARIHALPEVLELVA